MAKPLRVLAIDDEETMLKIIRRSLEPENCVVETFGNSSDAIVRLKTGDPVDIVITDLMLPDIDGLYRQTRWLAAFFMIPFYCLIREAFC